MQAGWRLVIIIMNDDTNLIKDKIIKALDKLFTQNSGKLEKLDNYCYQISS